MKTINVLGFRLTQTTPSTWALVVDGQEYRIRYKSGIYQIITSGVTWFAETLEEAVSEIADEMEGWDAA